MTGLKKSKGNMYTWVTHMHSHLGGECSHKCIYCYVDGDNTRKPKRYQGPLRLIEEEFNVDYGSGKIIFIEHCNDMLAEDVPDDFIMRILNHCNKYPDNKYVFQTKNPKRYLDIFFNSRYHFPKNSIFGCTIESNRSIQSVNGIPLKPISNAPSTYNRMINMISVASTHKTFITIEPILDFDVEAFSSWIGKMNPSFINIGADSKNHNLPEPTIEKIMQLVDKVKNDYNIEIEEKHNLERLKLK